MPKCQNHNRNTISRIFFGHARVMGVNHRTWCSWEEFLKQQQAILAFINAGGLEDLEFVNSIEYRRSFEVPPPICDAYHFKSGFSVGYISFFFSESNRKWIIKSLHRDDACGPTIMEFALRKAGSLPACLEGSE